VQRRIIRSRTLSGILYIVRPRAFRGASLARLKPEHSRLILHKKTNGAKAHFEQIGDFVDRILLFDRYCNITHRIFPIIPNGQPGARQLLNYLRLKLPFNRLPMGRYQPSLEVSFQ
jgi:hypothetical protein